GGLGLMLGLIIGHVPLPLPGGGTFAIGAAAGTLLMGLIMGRLGRVGRVITTLPYTAAMTLTEFGLLIFLAYAGTRAGGQISQAFASGEWWRILVLGAVITLVMGGLAYIVGRWLFRSGGTRLSGMIAGMQTQPALLAYANGRTNFDPRIGLGYALAYPAAMVTKILVATVLAAL
ncbi:MAG: transporter, partial [Propionibacteriaceae bacterium]|nr:transporter [Propionibacteriaceae bacterium]